MAIFGAVGSGKTSACMHPFARQLLSWQATNPERRAAALVLEVKGDFCHDIRRMLTELDRGEDYIELSLDGRLTWNPPSATWLDSYSLAYTVASLLNQLFGKGKEPFWQQAYTNLVRWIIELYRVLPGGWVTLRDVYHCAIDKELFANKIERSRRPSLDPTTWSDWSCALTRPLSLPSWAWGTTRASWAGVSGPSPSNRFRRSAAYATTGLDSTAACSGDNCAYERCVDCDNDGWACEG